MTTQDFTTTFLVDQTPEEAFGAINNISGWWTENVEGNSQKQGDEFSVQFGDVHYSKQKLTEVVPNQKVVWLVTDSRLNFLKEKDEWTGMEIVFDITPQDGQTQVRFTQKGLTPQMPCFGDCSGAWGYYINDSLRSLITTGKGQPAAKAS